MLSSILYQVLLLLFAAVIAGELFRHLGFPSVAGELLSGILVGPAVLGLVNSSQELSPLAFVALFFVIYHLGFDAKTEKLKKYVARGLTVSVTSFVAPFIVVLVVTRLVFTFGTVQDFVLALAVSVPSISIISVLVKDAGIQEKESGHLILASIVIVDIVSFIILAAVTRTIGDTLRIIIFTVLFILAFLAVDYFISHNPGGTRKIFRRLAGIVKGEEMAYATLILTGLVVSELFQVIGLVYVLGAFFAALIVHEEVIGIKLFEKVSGTMRSMNEAFFAPFFFGYAGSEAVLKGESLYSILIIAGIALLVVGLAVLFTYYGTFRMLREEDGTRRIVSFIMAGKGSVGIIIANVALDAGIISYTANSLVIIATIVGSLAVTLLLRGSRGGRSLRF